MGIRVKLNATSMSTSKSLILNQQDIYLSTKHNTNTYIFVFLSYTLIRVNWIVTRTAAAPIKVSVSNVRMDLFQNPDPIMMNKQLPVWKGDGDVIRSSINDHHCYMYVASFLTFTRERQETIRFNHCKRKGDHLLTSSHPIPPPAEAFS